MTAKRPWRSKWSLPELAVALTAAAVHLRAISNGYAADDAVILANPLLRAWHTLPAALASPWWHTTGHLYRPLALITLGAEQLIARGPWLSHGINIVLHATIAALLTRFLRRLVHPRAALLAGLLFAVLPAHVEAVATLVGRTELLAALAIIALLLLVSGDRAPTRGARITAALLAAMALASKEGGVTAPALVLAATWTFDTQRPNAWRWTLAAAQGTAIMLLARLAALGTLGGDLPHPAFRVASLGERLALALSVMPHVVAMLLLPVRPAIEVEPGLRGADDGEQVAFAELGHPRNLTAPPAIGEAIRISVRGSGCPFPYAKRRTQEAALRIGAQL